MNALLLRLLSWLSRQPPAPIAPAPSDTVLLVPDFVEPATLVAVLPHELPDDVDPKNLRVIRLGRLTLIVRVYVRRVNLSSF